MRATRLVALALLVATAASLVRAAATRDGLGAFEYVASVLIVLILIGLAATTFSRGRRAQRAGALAQFASTADTAKGNRPSFTAAAPPEDAEPLYERFCGELRELGVAVQAGVFGARIEVELVNDGPVTIILWTIVLGVPRNGKEADDP